MSIPSLSFSFLARLRYNDRTDIEMSSYYAASLVRMNQHFDDALWELDYNCQGFCLMVDNFRFQKKQRHLIVLLIYLIRHPAL